MRNAALAFLLVALAGVIALALTGAGERRTLAFTLGVAPSQAVIILRPHAEVCQRPIPVATAFDSVKVWVLPTSRRVAPTTMPTPTTPSTGPLTIAVRPLPTTATIARGTLPAGMWRGQRLVRTGHVEAGRSVAICIRNMGGTVVALAGDVDAAARGSSAFVDGAATGNDIALSMHVTHARGTLALLPDMLDRAALFRGGWVGAWLLWTLLAAVVLAVPALLAWALVAATRDERT